jgi:long-chain acyl-CoA synthetase
MSSQGRQESSMTNLSCNLTAAAEMYPDRPALRCEDTTTTYSALAGYVARLARFLTDAGIEPGDRVGMMLPNTPAFAVVYFGILHAGGVVVPMNPLQSGREVEFFLTNTGAKALFYAPACAAAATTGAQAAGARHLEVDDHRVVQLTEDYAPLPRPVDRMGEDTAVILHTSGTTGIPKGAELTHDNIIRNQIVTARKLLHLGPGDVMMGCLPLFHAFGMTCGLVAALSSGATLALIPRFDPRRALETIAAERVTVFEGVPTMYSTLLAAADQIETDTGSLRVCISGGAALPVEVLRKFEAAFGCVILEGYGLSETSPAASFNHPDAQRKVGSIGTPIEGVQMRVVAESGEEMPVGETGEIQIRGHNVMKGYWGLPEATAAAVVDGWFATGDLGRVDEDGYFYIVDRKKDMIIRGGYNVYPREIEEVLYEHPAVAEAAVVGIPHEVLGEEVGAAIALAADATATPTELQDFVKQRVAAYKYPRRIWLVDELPKNSTGKILRRSVVVPDGQS